MTNSVVDPVRPNVQDRCSKKLTVVHPGMQSYTRSTRRRRYCDHFVMSVCDVFVCVCVLCSHDKTKTPDRNDLESGINSSPLCRIRLILGSKGQGSGNRVIILARTIYHPLQRTKLITVLRKLF